MKKLLFAALLLSAPVLAQPARVQAPTWSGDFSLYDADKSGDLDGPEWRALKDDIEHNKDKYMALDTNQDGDISDDEIDAALHTYWGPKHGRRASIAPGDPVWATQSLDWTPTGWSTYDKNTNHRLDDDEWDALRNSWTTTNIDEWRRFDLNNDGKLSQEELNLARRHAETLP